MGCQAVEVATLEGDDVGLLGGADGDDEDNGVRLAILLQQALPHPDLQQNDGEKHGIIIIQVSSNTFFNAKWVSTRSGTLRHQ